MVSFRNAYLFKKKMVLFLLLKSYFFTQLEQESIKYALFKNFKSKSKMNTKDMEKC